MGERDILKERDIRTHIYFHAYIFICIRLVFACFLMHLRAYQMNLLENVRIKMVVKLTARKIIYRPKSRRSKMVAIIFHS